ncbi:betaine/proline/choline family ABC transporter ATP-binding protein [Amphritea sp. ZJ14W]|uniref:Quaternary amine transport ATP-binding protein n=2 Tax=Amphritea pacifica TaxID=2811233 RepID=A0ABS2W7Y9_9GAMM|nr:betaine/proline/choline family ABC transporter ATP-binding protein [Amphritea pacifica]MBN1008080.1 betaine/proline/choline family ABC transporter ATP-binding protein [Amphritea pacifica]
MNLAGGHLSAPAATQEARETILSVSGLWKVFGASEKEFNQANGTQLSDEEFAAHGWTAAVKDATFDVKQGEIFVIMGLSGSGKSTLIRSLTRLNTPTAGLLEIDGQDITHATPDKLLELRRKSLGMVFQNFALLPNRTVESNISFPLEIQGISKEDYSARAQELVDLVGLRGREDHYPAELSGGQQQRVGIARSLATNPKIWVLDEPFSALDPLIRNDLQDEVLRLQATLHKTVIFITHDLDEAMKIADRIAIMENGRIVQIGRPEELISAPADDYVKRFVSKVPLAKVTRVKHIMSSASTQDLPGPSVSANDTIAEIGPLIIDAGTDIPVTEDGKIVGVLAKERAIRVLAGARD